MIDNIAPIWLILGLYLLNIYLDKLDGNLARKAKLQTQFGQYWDIAVDRYVQISMLLVIGLNIDNFSYFGLLLILARDFLLSGIRQFCAQKNIFLKGRVWGKIKATLEMLAIFYGFGMLLGINIISDALTIGILNSLIYMAVFFGFLSFYFYYQDNKKVFKENW